MAGMLRSLVSSPRVRHEEAKFSLDLAYITPQIIVMSMPAAAFPETLYRNPLNEVVGFLDHKHGNNWAVFEFRAEGAGYDDADFGGRVSHFPFPDHNPPPFRLFDKVTHAMDSFLSANPENVAVLHCKAGKGRSGSMTCAYLMAFKGMSCSAAQALFSEKRMRIGNGVSIKSQRRYLAYYEHFLSHKRQYVPVSFHIGKVTIAGARPLVTLSVKTYVNEGREIESLYSFGLIKSHTPNCDDEALSTIDLVPDSPIRVQEDVCIQIGVVAETAFSKRIRANMSHVWFNAYFEKQKVGTGKDLEFRIAWDDMDGIKGTNKRGPKLLDEVCIYYSVDSKPA